MFLVLLRPAIFRTPLLVDRIFRLFLFMLLLFLNWTEDQSLVRSEGLELTALSN